LKRVRSSSIFIYKIPCDDMTEIDVLGIKQAQKLVEQQGHHYPLPEL
jgi:hypothetical protein